MEKVAASFSGHPHLVASPNHQVFTLKHYAGDVTYDVNGFVEKNRDTLYNDLISLGQSSKCRFIQSLFPDDCGLANKKRPTSAGFKIKSSISELVEALSKCTPHYVRCIKSNNNKQAGEFDQNLVMHQVHYLALLENVRVRRAGYAYRQLYDKFYFRYRVCSSKTWPHWSGNNRDATSAILADCAVEETGYRLGHNKVFIRKPEVVSHSLLILRLLSSFAPFSLLIRFVGMNLKKKKGLLPRRDKREKVVRSRSQDSGVL